VAGESLLAPALSANTLIVHVPDVGAMTVYHNDVSQGRPLVLLHSINAAPSAMEIRPLFDHYAPNRPVYAPDLPGFGLSTRGGFAYSPGFFAAVLADWLSTLPGPAPDIVAMSLTGEFVARAIVEHDIAVNSLTLISPTGFDDRKLPARLPVLETILSIPGVAASLYRMLTSKMSIRYFLRQSFVGEPAADMVDYAHQTARIAGARWAPLSFLTMRLFSPEVFDAIYSRLNVPTLVLYDRDPNVRFSKLSQIVAQNPMWRSERLVPSKGLPHWEQLGSTADALDRFWREMSVVVAA
jgi:pimeloyl-ACP methyl ester carboxylesterase